MALSVRKLIYLQLLANYLTSAIALQCYVCSSYNWESCFNTNENIELPVEECSPEIQFCLTEIAVLNANVCWDPREECSEKLSREFIIRGCLDNNGPKNFPGVNSQKYRTCSSSLCNNEMILKKKCPTCNSDGAFDCGSEIELLPQLECPFTIEPMGCYQKLNSSSNVIDRGCVSSLSPDEANLCEGKSPCVLKMSGDETNNNEENALTIEIGLTVVVDSTKKETFHRTHNDVIDFNEIVEPLEEKISNDLTSEISNTSHESKSESSIVTDLTSEISSSSHENKPENTIVTETNKHDEPDQTEISSSIEKVNSNSQILEEAIDVSISKSDKFSCYKCKGYLDSECAIDPLYLNEQCEISERIGCFIDINHSEVTRGCLNDLNGADYEKCRESDLCFICSERNCNFKTVQSSATKSSYSNFVFVIVFIYYQFVL